jgi:iron(III) transport system substrate-binding protein
MTRHKGGNMKLTRLISAATATSVVAGIAFAGVAGASGRAKGTGQPRRAESAQSALQALYHEAVAKKQTSVVIYGPSAGTDTPLYEAFKKQFPAITVTGVPVVGPPMSAKLAAEFSSGKHVADIAYTGSTDMLRYAQTHWLVPFTPVTAPAPAKLPLGDIGPQATFYGTSIAPFVTIYNKSEVKASQVPKTWQDFLKPEWKGKIGIVDPTAIGEMDDVFAHLEKVPGMANYMTKLHAQNVEVYPATEVTGPLTAVAQGAKAIGIEEGFAFYQVAVRSGAPIGFSLLAKDNYTTTLYMGQLKGAPDPLASRLYEDWLFSAPAQAVMAANGNYSPVPGAPAPKGLPPYAQLPKMPYIPLSGILKADLAAIAQAKKLWG